MAQATREASTLGGYIRCLTSGGTVSTLRPGESWARLTGRIAASGPIAEVDEETFWHFLEVLPPKWIDGDAFCFAEGMEPFRLFWQDGTHYFCRQLTWDETHRFCDLAVGRAAR